MTSSAPASVAHHSIDLRPGPIGAACSGWRPVEAVPAEPGALSLREPQVPPCARWASVTVLRERQFRTLVATAVVAQQADALQHELGSGPGVEAELAGTVHVVSDQSQEPRWPRFRTRVSRRLGMVSLLAHRLPLLEDPETTVGLSLHSDARDAFDGQALWAGGILAGHCAMVVSAQLNRQRSGRPAQRPPTRP